MLTHLPTQEGPESPEPPLTDTGFQAEPVQLYFWRHITTPQVSSLLTGQGASP